MLRDHARRIFEAGLHAADPARLMTGVLSAEDRTVNIDGTAVPLGTRGRIFLLAAGKAAWPMAETARALLGPLVAGGLVVHRDPVSAARTTLPLLRAGHPLPDGNSLVAGERFLRLADRAGPEDLVLLLLSGGSSALLEAPAGRLTLQELRLANELLLRCGADIATINAVRTCLSRIKGGGLVRAAAPARVASLLLSDVVGDDPAVIGSGPGVPHDVDIERILSWLETPGAAEALPRAVLRQLEEAVAARNNTPGPGTPRSRGTLVRVIGSNRDARRGAAEAAAALHCRVTVCTAPVVGEARSAAGVVAARLEAAADGDLACYISGGETTVTLPAEHGRGGRNMELALAAAPLLAARPVSLLLSAGTDGSDGPTEAAGAFAGSDTLRRGAAAALNHGAYLRKHCSYSYFKTLDDLFVTGPTATNVGDLQVLLYAPVPAAAQIHS